MSDRSAEVVDREERDASAAPPTYSREGAPLAGCLIVSLVILLPGLLYFGLFAAILIDELVVGSNWFMNNLPEPALDFLGVIYAPLI